MAPVALKIGRATDTHHNQIVAWIKRKRLEDKFNNLPPEHEFTFWPIGDLSVKTNSTVGMKLFCGENPEHQTWAIVNAHPSSREVVLVNEYRTGEIETVTEPSKLALMYPFKVFKKHGNGPFNAMRQMRQLVMYLSSGIGRISNDYKAKGIENVPDLHAPSEGLSIVRQSNGVRPIDQLAPPLYNDDLKSVVSGGSIDEVAPDGKQVPDQTVAPAHPRLDDNADELESRLESIVVPDIESTPPAAQQKLKRAREEHDEGYGSYRQLMEERQELDRMKIDHKEKRKRIEANMTIIARKQAEKEEALDALLARTPKEEMTKWLMRPW